MTISAIMIFKFNIDEVVEKYRWSCRNGFFLFPLT